MSREQFQEDCAACRPVLVDLETGKPLADDHPAQQTIIAAWAKTTREEREAFHNVTCLNSRDSKALDLVQRFLSRAQSAPPRH